MAFIVPRVSNSMETVPTEAYCTSTKTLVSSLSEKYKERPFILGKTGDQAGSIMSLWINPTSKSWTIVATKDDISCVIGVGEDFKIIPYPTGPTV